MIIIPDSIQIEANTRSTHGRSTGRKLTLVIISRSTREHNFTARQFVYIGRFQLTSR